MDFLRNGDIYTLGTAVMQLLGENIYYTSKKTIVLRTINCAILSFITIFICANFWNATGSMYVNTLEDLTTVLHTSFKYLLFMYYKDEFRRIFDDKRNKFWRMEKYYGTNSQKNIESLYRAGKLVQILMLFGLTVCVYMIFFKPLINENNVFLLDSRMLLDSISMDVLILFFHYYFFCICGAIVFIYDATFLSLCLDLAVQVRLLKYQLKYIFENLNNVDENIMWSELARCVDHHLFLLTIFNRMRRIYSITLLFHYFISVFTACFDMYESFIGEEALADQVLKFMSVAVILGQFAFYALPADLIASEFLDVSSAVYNSKWYVSSASMQRMVVLIIARSQRVTYFSAAGFLDINIDTFGSVIRKTFSFYAIIRNMFNKN